MTGKRYFPVCDSECKFSAYSMFLAPRAILFYETLQYACVHRFRSVVNTPFHDKLCRVLLRAWNELWGGNISARYSSYRILSVVG